MQAWLFLIAVFVAGWLLGPKLAGVVRKVKP